MRYFRLLVCLTALVCLCMLFCAASADVYINELLALNGIPEDGRSDDWLELYNDSPETVDLTGWSISVKRDFPVWTFPKGARIAGNGYLVVYCTEGEARPDGALSTDFKLSAEGRTLILIDSNDTEVQILKYPEQYGNISYGRTAGNGEYLYLETPTPGKQNAAAGYALRCYEPEFVTAPGFYKKALTVELKSEPGSEIRYTTDCSTPSRNSTLYTGPIPVRSTTVIRAVAVNNDMLVSTVAGGTFIIESEASPVPVVSVYTDDDYFYGGREGILVKGYGKTPNYENETLKHPVQFEYFDENGVRRFSSMGTVDVSGHSSRSLPQKSLSINADNAYGGDFEYSFFEDRDYTSYHAILLRNASSDALYCRLRDPVISEISEGLGLYYAAARPIVVYINGAYSGHYNLREKWNKYSIAQRDGITDEAVINSIDYLEGSGLLPAQVLEGSNTEWAELMRFCQTENLNNPENLKYVTDRIDVESMFTYIIYNSLVGNTDYGNVRMYRFPGEKWKFILHDVESSGKNLNPAPIDNYTKSKSGTSEYFPRWPFVALMEVPEYRDMFLRMLAEITESNLLYWPQVEPVFTKWINALTPIMSRHCSKYKSLTVSSWLTNVHACMYYVRLRPEKVIGYYCDWLNVTRTEKEQYFGHTLELLSKYNGKEKPKE